MTWDFNGFDTTQSVNSKPNHYTITSALSSWSMGYYPVLIEMFGGCTCADTRLNGIAPSVEALECWGQWRPSEWNRSGQVSTATPCSTSRSTYFRPPPTPTTNRRIPLTNVCIQPQLSPNVPVTPRSSTIHRNTLALVVLTQLPNAHSTRHLKCGFMTVCNSSAVFLMLSIVSTWGSPALSNLPLFITLVKLTEFWLP